MIRCSTTVDAAAGGAECAAGASIAHAWCTRSWPMTLMLLIQPSRVLEHACISMTIDVLRSMQPPKLHHPLSSLFLPVSPSSPYTPRPTYPSSLPPPMHHPTTQPWIGDARSGGGGP